MHMYIKILSVCCIFCVFILIFPFSPSVTAADYTITNDFTVAFPKNQQLIECPESGYFLLSTDGENFTRITYLTEKENMESALWSIQTTFVFDEALCGETFLYLIEKKMDTASGINIGIMEIQSHDFTIYKAAIRPVYPLDWQVFGKGTLSIRASQLTDSAPGVFQLKTDVNPYQTSFIPDIPVSSSASSSSSLSSSTSSSSSPVIMRSIFSENTTLSALEKEYCGPNYFLKAYDSAGNPQSSGKIHTGWKLQLYKGTRLESSVTVIIPGDIGGQTVSANRSLYYRFLTGEIQLEEPYRTAADLNGDGLITVSDLVLFRSSHG